MSKILLFIILVMCSVISWAQDSPDYYVQFKVNTVSTIDEAKALDKRISKKKGIISAHTDHVTSTFFCTMSGDAEYIFDDFETWFEKMGYEIVCFNKGIKGDGRMLSPHSFKNCEEFNND